MATIAERSDAPTRSEREVVRTRTLVSFTLPQAGPLPARRRYLQAPGHKVYKGMYRNRRLAKVVRSTWTDDRALAHPFDSPSEARKLLEREFGAQRLRSYTLEAVKMRSVEHATTYANGRTRRWFDAWREAAALQPSPAPGL